MSESYRLNSKSATPKCTWLLFGIVLVGLFLAPPAVAGTDQDVLLVLDNSGSMKTNDPQFLTHKAVEAFVSSLDANVRVGILIFGQEPELVLPLSELFDSSDPELQAALERLDYTGQWTNTADALERSLYELKTNARDGAKLSIVLMTDGIVDTGDKATDLEKVEWMQTLLVKQALKEQIRIYGIAFTEKADFRLIQSLSVATNGDYYRILDPLKMEETFGDLLEDLLEPEPESAIEAPVVAAPPRIADAADSNTAYPAAAIQEQDDDKFVSRHTKPAETPAPMPVDNTYLYSGFGLLLALLGLIILLVLRRPKQSGQEVFMAKLIDLHGATITPELDLHGGIYIIGRVAGGGEEGAHYIVIRDTKVSRRHAVIRFHDAGHWITDQGGRNGTFVNEVELEKERLLKHGDIIRCSVYGFRYEIPGFDTVEETQFGGKKFHYPPPASAALLYDANEEEIPTEEANFSIGGSFSAEAIAAANKPAVPDRENDADATLVREPKESDGNASDGVESIDVDESEGGDFDFSDLERGVAESGQPDDSNHKS